MQKKDFKKLTRRELLEMLLDRSKEVEHLRTYLADANRRISELETQLKQVGSIDKAIKKLNRLLDEAGEGKESSDAEKSVSED